MFLINHLLFAGNHYAVNIYFRLYLAYGMIYNISCIHIYIYICIYIYIYIYICCIYIYVYIYIYIYICMHVCIYIYIYLYIYSETSLQGDREEDITQESDGNNI